MKKIILIVIIILCIIMTSINITYARYTYYQKLTGTVTAMPNNFCLNNGITKLGDCLLAMDSGLLDKQESIKRIKKRTEKYLDLNSTEPKLVYKKVLNTNKTINLVEEESTRLVFTDVEPIFDSTTGYYTFDNNHLLYGTFEDYKSDENKKYYTCNQIQNIINCGTVYIVYEYTKDINPATNLNRYTATKADIYTSTATGTSESNPGLYATNDDYGETYIYRGEVANNYIEYAGFIWRIVRINGDESIRLILNKDIAWGAFNPNVDPAYVGYMYGLDQVLKESKNATYLNVMSETKSFYFADNFECNDETKTCKLSGNKIYGRWVDKYKEVLNGDEKNGNVPYKYTCLSEDETSTCSDLIEVTNKYGNPPKDSEGKPLYDVHPNQIWGKHHIYISKDYESTYTDEFDSNAKKIIDAWYEEHILNGVDENENKYIDYLSDSVFCNDRSIVSGNFDDIINIEYNGNQTSTNLECPRKEDEFTVEVHGNIGNGHLKYPIALLTKAESKYAGATKSNSLFYLSYLFSSYFMTPSSYSVNQVPEVRISRIANGYFDTSSAGYPNNRIVPVINLNKDIKIIGGDGTKDSPYQIKI